MRRIRYGAILLGLAVTLLLLWRVYHPGSNPRTLVPQRTLEARLTGFQHRSPPRPGTERLTRSGAAEAAEKTANPESLRARGLEHLLYGDVEKAVGDLERAAEISPRDAALRSDLAAAYLVRAEEKQRPDDLIRGLSAALEANRLNLSLPEAAFNHALLSEKLFIRRQAIQAWKAYLELDRSSKWSGEAERHLQALEKPTLVETWPAQRKKLTEAAIAGEGATVLEIVRGAPQGSREYVEENLLGAWADAQAKGDLTGAARDLKAAEVIGAAVFEVTGDAMARDSVTGIYRVMSHPSDSRQLEHLVQGYRHFRDGKIPFNALKLEDAAPLMIEAQTELERAGSPLHGWAIFYHGVCAQRAGDFETALSDFYRAHSTTTGDYPALLGQAESMIGLTFNFQGRFDESLAYYNQALSRLEQSHQPQSTAILHFLIAEDLLLMGDNRSAESHLQVALSLSSQILKRRWVTTILEKAAESARLNGQFLASLELLNEAVQAARQDGNPAMLSEAFLSRSLTYRELSDQPSTLRDLDSAEDSLRNVDINSSIYRVMEAQLLAARGKALLKSAPEQVIADLSKALEDRSESGAAVWMTPLYLERGRAYLESGRTDLAEADFLAGVQAYEQRRPKISSEQLRISYFDQAREVFDEMVRLQAVLRHDPWRALQFSERARAQELLRSVAGEYEHALEPLSQGTIQRSLPSGVTILYYTVCLFSRICGWLQVRVAGQVHDTRRFPRLDRSGIRRLFWWSVSPCY